MRRLSLLSLLIVLLLLFSNAACTFEDVRVQSLRSGITIAEAPKPSISDTDSLTDQNLEHPTTLSQSQPVVMGVENPELVVASRYSSSRGMEPSAWMQLPIIPIINERALRIYQEGLERGNNPRAFSKIGDCQNVPSLFLAPFDDPRLYSLGDEHAYLAETIDWYAGSYSRDSEAVRRGFNAASVVSPFWSDPDACESGENPLVCELRLHRPSVALISLETWWEGEPENYERYIREIIETTLSYDVIPVLATKADNLEGEHQINALLADLAMEYDIPLWNFWRAVQPLPDQGLMEDGFHLTMAGNYFDDPYRMEKAWPWRNLTALQSLDQVRRAILEVENE